LHNRYHLSFLRAVSIISMETSQEANLMYSLDEKFSLKKKRNKRVLDVLISAANFRGITIRRILSASRGEIHGGAAAPLVEFHPTFYGTTSPAMPVGVGRGRRMARGEPRAIVIKHRELAKLRCNLAGDVLPCGLARRGPRAVPIHIHPSTYTRTYTHTCTQA